MLTPRTGRQIEDLKEFFEDEDEPADDAADGDGLSPGAFMLNPGAPRSREEILALIPDRQTVDGLVNRFFLANSPSQRNEPLSPLLSLPLYT